MARVKVKMRGLDLAPKDRTRSGRGKSDPYLKIFSAHDETTPMHTTEYIDDNLNPIWELFTLDLSHLVMCVCLCVFMFVCVCVCMCMCVCE